MMIYFWDQEHAAGHELQLIRTQAGDGAGAEDES